MTQDEMVEAMAREFARSRNPLIATDKYWAVEVEHFRDMVAQYGEDYANGRSTITDAFRDAKLVFAFLSARGLAVVNTHALKEQHRADGETLVERPDLLAAARRAHTLLVNIEVDAGEYYRETQWLEDSIKATESAALPKEGQG